MSSRDQAERHRVAVVRVEIRSHRSDDLLIALLEVGLHSDGDRLVGTAASPDEACKLLAGWLADIADR